MHDDTDLICCPDGECEPGGLSRRRFLTLTAGLASLSVLADRRAIAAALGVAEDDVFVVPADKRIPPEWMRTLYRRGEPTTYRGADLPYIGMPVGGICAGQLYLGGDGRLWRWELFNITGPATSDAAYLNPYEPSSPFRSGFALRVGDSIRSLDSDGFEDVRFTGQYPIGRVEYRDPGSPLDVTLEAFSPFVPLEVDDSSIPATILAYTLRNDSNRTVEAELLGWSENPVCLRSRTRQPTRLHSAAFGAPGVSGLEFSASLGDIGGGEPRPDIPFEDWERETYEGWTVEGNAFGPGPVLETSVPDYMRRFGDLNVTGVRFVTSHAFWAGDVGQADALTGRLLSRPFTIERRYVQTRVGGGSWARTAVRVLVDGEVVASASGTDIEPMTLLVLDVARWEGRTAQIEIVDQETGGWGHVNVDDIVFTDRPPEPTPLSELPDAGTFALAALADRARVRPSIAAWSTLEEMASSGPGPDVVDASLAEQAGTVGVTVRIPPRRSATVRFALGWFFPLPDRRFLGFLRDAANLRHHYSTRFTSAQDVVRDVARERHRLEGKTRLWVKTFYEDSTLPHWFLERTHANASTLATTVCHRFQDGRFYGWEGTYCCAGTCQHVWNYAQAVARLFPALERDTRERVDLDIAFNPQTGQTGFRAEADMNWAADGQAGTILRCYREHLTATDDAFVLRNWPRIKRAVEFLIAHDAGPDGTLDGSQHNTLDANWFGEIAWISSIYVAALYAAAELAAIAGDAAFERRCRDLAGSGARILETRLWNGENFIHRLDPAHANIVNHNVGCHIDQMLGQSLAWQIGALPRVMPADKCRTALERVYRYNFTPDAAGWRAINTAFGGGRWFALEDEHGVIMTTWPNGGAEEAPGNPASWSAIYFNECWSGQEYQLAAHMLAEGLVEQGLLVTRAVHERYRPHKRNPYNEIECSEHYARAMASYGAFTTICGFEYDGPDGHIGFAPRLDEDDFAAAFTAAAGWGLYRQRRHGRSQRCEIEVRHGELELESLALAVARPPRSVTVTHGHRRVRERRVRERDGRLEIALRDRIRIEDGETLTIRLTA